MPFVVSEIKDIILSKFVSSRDLMSEVEQFPRRIQITFGGKPKKKTILLKSLCFVTMVNPSFFANSQTVESFTNSRLKAFRCFEPVQVFIKWLASFGDKFWSNSNYIRNKVLFVPYLRHNLNKPKYLPFQGMGNHQEFLQNSYLKPGNLEHLPRLSACPSRMVCRFFSRIQVLFFHLVTWLIFLSFIQTKIYNSIENTSAVNSNGFTPSEALTNNK